MERLCHPASKYVWITLYQNAGVINKKGVRFSNLDGLTHTTMEPGV